MTKEGGWTWREFTWFRVVLAHDERLLVAASYVVDEYETIEVTARHNMLLIGMIVHAQYWRAFSFASIEFGLEPACTGYKAKKQRRANFTWQM